MKRFVCMLVALSLVLLASCAGKDIPDVQKQDSGAEEVISEKESEETEEKVEKEIYTLDETPTIEEKVIVDEKGIRITALKLDYSGSFGPRIDMLVENNTNRDVMIQSRDSSINGAVVESNFTFDIAAGDSKNEDIRFAKADMELYGIKAIETFEFGILISDAGNWETIVSVDAITVETSAEKTEHDHFAGFEDVLYENGGVKICVNKTRKPSTLIGTELTVGFENNTERDLKIKASDVVLDNAAVSSAFSAIVPAGKTVIKEMTFSEWELKSLNVHDVKKITLNFIMTDPETKETVFETEEITVTLAE